MATWNRDDSDLAVTTGVASSSIGNVRITGSTIGLSSDTDILTLADNALSITATSGLTLKNSDLILKNSGDSTTITLDASSGAITGSTLDVSTLTVSGAQTYSSLLTATAGVKLGNNIIYNSQGEQTLTLDNDMNLTCENNLTVDGTATVTGTTTLGTVNTTGLVTATDTTGFKAVNPSDASIYGTMGSAAFSFSGDVMSTIFSQHDLRLSSGTNKKILFSEVTNQQFHFDMTDHILMVGASGRNYTLDVDGSVEFNSDAGSFSFKDDSATLFTIGSSGDIRAYGAATIDGALTLGTGLADSNIASASAWNAKLDSSGTIADNDFAKFNSGGDLVGRSYAEVRSDLGISDDEIIDWTANQGDTNIHESNFGNVYATNIVASGTSVLLGLITATSGIKLYNNEIYASDGDVAITTDTSSNVTIAGALQVNSNVIKASDGGAAIVMDTADNVGIGNDLNTTGSIMVGSNIIRAADAGTCITMDNDSNVAITGGLTIGSIPTDTAGDNYLVEVSGVVKKRTPAETLSDIGAQASLSFGISNTNVTKCGSGIVDNDFIRVDGTTFEGRSASEVLSDIGAQASLTFGISDTNITRCGAGIVDDDFIRVNGTTFEGRSASEVRSDIGAGTSSVAALNDLSDVSYSSGDLTITSLDTMATTSLQLLVGDGEQAAFTIKGNGNTATAFQFGLEEDNYTRFEMREFGGASTSDYFAINVSEHGDTVITTFDAAATAANLHIDVDGVLKLDAADTSDGKGIQLASAGTIFAQFDMHHTTSFFRMYEAGGASTNDYFQIVCEEHGATTLTTLDAAAAAADLTLTIDGDIDMNSVGNIELDSGGFVHLDPVSHTYSTKPIGFVRAAVTYNATDTNALFDSVGNKLYLDLTGNTTNVNLHFPAVTGNFTLLIKQDGTGSRTVGNWKAFDTAGNAANGDANVKWSGGTAPTLTTATNHVDIISFFWDATSETAYGVASLDFQD